MKSIKTKKMASKELNKYDDINYFKSLKKEDETEFSRQSYKCIMDLLNAEKLSQNQWQVLKFLSTKSYNKKTLYGIHTGL